MRTLFFIISCLVFISCASKKAPTIIAHRGASGYLPEHTLEAYAAAHMTNVDFIEQDVVLTKDNVPIIVHDIHLDSTTNVRKVFPKRARKDGRYYAIDFKLSEIKKLQVTERFDFKSKKAAFENRFPLFYANFEVPTLEEAIELIRGMNKSRKVLIGMYIEMKDPEFHTKHKKDIAAITVHILKKHKMWHEKAKVILQCFEPNTLKRLRRKFRSPLKLVQLIAENDWKETSANYEVMKSKQGLKDIATYADGIGPWIAQLQKEPKLVRWAHEAGLIVHPYTARADAVQKPFKNFEELHDYLFIELGVDGVFTDFPDKSLKL